jgi:tRNA pseudouridine55 synthase
VGGAPIEGLLVVDKPGGLTSHDVVARVRRFARTRKVGHAGTLDPMATGVLVLGLGRATRLLGHLAGSDKAYDATIRLGVTTSTDDAEGQLISVAPPGAVTAISTAGLSDAVAGLTGEIIQVPATVSAIKVGGRRAHVRARAGEEVVLTGRPVTVSEFTITAVRHGLGSHDGPFPFPVLDLDVTVACSTGTYVRALARDLGAALGVGGHLTALRRTRVGPYTLAEARTLTELESELAVLPLAEAAARTFTRRLLDADEAGRLAHGIAPVAIGQGPGPVAAYDPAGALIALVQERDGLARPLVVFPPA